jgi:hypothetical protein
MSSFDYYPSLIYNGEKAKFILAHAQVKEKYLRDYKSFFTYLIKEGERADKVAYDQYNDPNLDWVIYIMNGIFDPYKDWPLDENQMTSYLETKYNMPAYKLQSITDNATIAHYYYTGIESLSESNRAIDVSNINYTITPETYDGLVDNDVRVWNSVLQSYITATSGWKPKSIFDYEHELNDSKREIIILRPELINDFKKQFKDLFKTI